jgi:hypothetical protein
MRQRWLAVGLLALGIFVINVIARVVTKQFEIVDAANQLKVASVGIVAMGILLIGAGAWWAVRHPFSRLFFDIGAAVLAGPLLSLILGPYAGGSKPFVEGPGAFVGQMLLFIGIAALGVLLGFAAMVTFGKDWRSRRLERYETAYTRRPRRPVRG